MEKNIELEISTLLPGVEQDDRCYYRLEAALQSNKKLIRAHLEKGQQPATLCLHYDPEAISLPELKQIASRAGAAIVNRYRHELFEIEGMDCSDCALVIEHSISRMEGVLSASISYPAKNMRVEYDTHKTNRAAIEKRIRSMGYQIPLHGFQSWFVENRSLIFSLVSGALVLAGWLGARFLNFPSFLSLACYLAAYASGGWDISRHALHTLRERAFDTDLLMVLAALGAAVLGAFGEGALLIFLFSLGHALEDRALDRARSAVHALADLAPKYALVRRAQVEVEVPVDKVALEDVVVIKPGMRIPVDGLVLSGQSAVNQAPVTGESIPVDKGPGERLFAGTVNGDGALEVRVTRLARDSTLAQVMRMVEEAQTQKSHTQQVVEKFERFFIPAVLAGTVLMILVPPIFGLPLRESFLRAMTLLVAASPCALALGAPAVTLAGIGQAARNGILVKGGAHLENLGQVKAIAFDKTGTITSGLPELTDLAVFPLPACPINTEDDLLAYAAAVELRSGHPLGAAIVRAAQKKQIPLPPAADVESATGRGVRASILDQHVLIGNIKWLEETGISIPARVNVLVGEWQAKGKTLMGIAWGDQIAGLIGLADALRPGVRSMIQGLSGKGLQKTILLTGDNSQVAEAVAGQAGISLVMANLMPADKLTAIRDLTSQFGVVGMVGDGVNDAPALANATVGIAMGGAATDVALETADVALMGDDLSRLPYAIGLGRTARRMVIQNLVIALGAIGVLAITSIFGLTGIGIAIFFHESSTIVVVLNALRLLRYQG